MSIGEKHRLADGGEENGRSAKKTKASDKLPRPSDSKELLKGKERKQKEKREKKEEKRKRRKERKDLKLAGEPPQEQNGANGPVHSTPYVYKQTADLDNLAASKIQDFLNSNQILVSDPNRTDDTALRPILEFAHLPPSLLLSRSPFASFTTPTPIQAASWPYSLSGRDVVGIAETGSGKTLAFSIPCVESILSLPKPPRTTKHSKTAYPRAIILSPTRELAMQTHVAISTLASLVGLSVLCIYGGASKDEQRVLLQKKSGPDIVVATPGRLKDFIGEESLALGHVKFVVLDEADRMLDKGFEEDVKIILGSCPDRESRQTLMFTATWPVSVRGLAESFMKSLVRITIGGGRRVAVSTTEACGNIAACSQVGDNGTVELQANSRIVQKVEVVDPRAKEQRLVQLLRVAQQGKGKSDRILVFCLYKKEAVRVERFLQQRGVCVASIHGDLKQEQRTRSLEAFKSGTTTVLVATDVAARGLDIPEVKLVINLTVSPLKWSL